MIQMDLLRTRDHQKAIKYQDRMLDLLSDGQWWKGRVLCAVLHTNERVIRQIADRQHGAVISSDHGYKLTRFATLSEIDHAAARLRSQAQKMLARAVSYETAKHKGRAA